MNWLIMILGLVLFMQGLFFEIQSMKPDKGFHFVGFQDGYIVDQAEIVGGKAIDKDGNEFKPSFLIFKKKQTPTQGKSNQPTE